MSSTDISQAVRLGSTMDTFDQRPVGKLLDTLLQAKFGEYTDMFFQVSAVAINIFTLFHGT